MFLDFPLGPLSVVPYLLGGQEWNWTASFEAFDSQRPRAGAPARPRPAEYRFVVDGHHREGGQAMPYHLESGLRASGRGTGSPPRTSAWSRTARVSLKVGPRKTIQVPSTNNQLRPSRAEIGPIDYPDSYHVAQRSRSSATAGSSGGTRRRRTTRRSSSGTASRARSARGPTPARPRSVKVTFIRVGGLLQTFQATLEDDGRWHTSATLLPGDQAFVETANIRDTYRNFNGEPSETITRPLV